MADVKMRLRHLQVLISIIMGFDLQREVTSDGIVGSMRRRCLGAPLDCADNAFSRLPIALHGATSGYLGDGAWAEGFRGTSLSAKYLNVPSALA